MELSHYFTPIEFEAKDDACLGAHMTMYEDGMDCQDFDLGILYVGEDRWREEIPSTPKRLEGVVQNFADLYAHGYTPKVLVFGSFNLGSSISDTEAGLSEVLDYLLQCRVVPMIIGGGRNLTYSLYRAFVLQEQITNITSIDKSINLDGPGNTNYVGRIIQEQPNFLFNYSNIGYQTYYVVPKELDLAEELYFDAYRLGIVRGQVYDVEPVIRSAEISSFSFDMIKSGDFGASTAPQPNGIYAEEACQIMRYIGLAEKSRLILLSDLDPERLSESDSMLIAQMMWCIVDGYYGRKTELPGGKKEGFLKYRVPLKNDEFQLIFYKSLTTDRWWMEIPVPPQYANKYRKHHLVPCGYDDYLVATRNDLPERWWKAYKKML